MQMLQESQENKKDAVIALKKFNSMYEEVTSKGYSEIQYNIVFNYGTLMLRQFPKFFSDHVETPGKVETLEKTVIKEKNKKFINIK